MNSLGESAENQVFRVRKPSVQKNKCFVCVYAGNKSSVNTPSGRFVTGRLVTGCFVTVHYVTGRFLGAPVDLRLRANIGSEAHIICIMYSQ